MTLTIRAQYAELLYDFGLIDQSQALSATRQARNGMEPDKLVSLDITAKQYANIIRQCGAERIAWASLPVEQAVEMPCPPPPPIEDTEDYFWS